MPVGTKIATDSRVVVTGLGAVSSIGIGAGAFCEGLRRGLCGISKIRAFDTTGFRSDRAGEVHGFDPGPWVCQLDPRRLGRSSQFAVAAARMAIADAGIDLATVTADLERAGVRSFCDSYHELLDCIESKLQRDVPTGIPSS